MNEDEELNEDTSSQDNESSSSNSFTQKAAQKGMEKARKQVTKKATKTAAKAAKAGSKMASLGPILVYVIIAIVIIIVFVGIIMFLITMPGMVMEKIKQLGKAIGDVLLEIFGVDKTLDVDDNTIYTTLDYLEEMGYDLKGFGFLTDYITTEEQAKSVNKNIKNEDGLKIDKEEGVAKNNDGKIISAKSDFIYNYLVSDNYVYTLKNENHVSGDGTGGFFNGAVGLLESIVDFVFNGELKDHWSRGFIAIYKDNGILGNPAGTFFNDSAFKLGDYVDINPEAKTLEIKKGVLGNAMTYKLEGWTGRYGMPVDFLLSVHLATMMPDLAYDMATTFNTQLYLLLHPIGGGNSATAVGYYKGVSYDTLAKDTGSGVTGVLNRWRVSREEGYNLFKNNPSLESPADCIGPENERYEAPVVAEPPADFDENVIGGNTYDISTTDTNYQTQAVNRFNTMIDNFKNYGCTENKISTFSEFESLLTKEENKTTYERTAGSTYNGGGDYEKKEVPLEEGEIIASCNQPISWTGKAPAPNSDENCTYMTTINIIYENYSAKDEEGTDISKNYIRITYKPITRSETESEIKAEIESKKEKLRAEGKTEEEIAGMSDDEILANISCSTAARGEDSGDYTGCCDVCRAYLQKIYNIVSAVDVSNFQMYQPYISSVEDHWYRDVYFVAADANEEFIDLDYEYEAVMKERWTLYETYTDSGSGYKNNPSRAGDYILYAVDKNGDYATKKRDIENASKTNKIKQAGKYFIYDGTQEEANTEEIKVAKKAITSKISDNKDELSWNDVGNNMLSAYKLENVSTTTKQQAFEGITEGDDDYDIKKDVSVEITLSENIVQTGEGQRTETNPEIKKMFLNNTYFRYDGSQETAEAITKLRNNNNLNYGPLNEGQGGKTLNSILKLKTTIGEGDNKKEYTVSDVSGQVNLNQDSLNAFSMLENTHTLDADYIYKDFKELIVELGYFDKEELTDETPKLLQFPIPEIGSYGYPRRTIDKRENEPGTMIHSKYDIDANGKYTLAQSLLDEEGNKTVKSNAEINEGEATSDEKGKPSVNLKKKRENSQKAADEVIKRRKEEGRAKSENKAPASSIDVTNLVGATGSTFKGDTLIETATNCWQYIVENGNKYTYAGASIPVNNGTTVDCSSFVSWILYEYGFEEFGGGQHNTGQFYNTNWTEAMGWEEIPVGAGADCSSELKAGDLLVRDNGSGDGHIQFIASIEDGDIIVYDCGDVSHWSTRDNMDGFVSNFARGDSKGRPGKIIRIENTQLEKGEKYVGYYGNEAVVSPVTGILLEYGTYDKQVKSSVSGDKYRVNVDLKYGPSIKTENDFEEKNSKGKKSDSKDDEQNIVVDKVGYAKILVLNDEAYRILESNTDNSWKENYGSLQKEKGGYLEELGLKTTQEQVDKQIDAMPQIDKTVYGYKEFVENYEKFGIAGNVIYIDGFKTELPDKDFVSSASGDEEDDDSTSSESIDLSNEKIPDGEDLSLESFKIKQSELTDEKKLELIQSLYEMDEKYKTANEEINVKLNAENNIKDKASSAIYVDKKIKVKKNKYDAIFIKEGTVLGRTYTDKELVEKLRGEKIENYQDALVVNKKTDSDDKNLLDPINTDKIIGNYVRVIMRDQKNDTPIENVEDYMKLDDGEEDANYDNDYELFYWLPFESGGTDLDGQGPEIQGSCSNGETAIGLVQWTVLTNSNMNNISEQFIKGCLEENPTLCAPLKAYESWTAQQFWEDYSSGTKEFQKVVSGICDVDRDAFVGVQMEVAKKQYLDPIINENTWLGERPSCVQGEVMHLHLWGANYKQVLDDSSASDEEIIKKVRTVIANTGSTSGPASGDETKGRAFCEPEIGLRILSGEIPTDKVEQWVRTANTEHLGFNVWDHWK